MTESCPACGALPCDWVDNPHKINDCSMALILAEIRQIIGVDEKPVLADLPEFVRRAMVIRYNQGLKDAAYICDDRYADDGEGSDFEDGVDAAFCIAADIRGKIIE